MEEEIKFEADEAYGSKKPNWKIFRIRLWTGSSRNIWRNKVNWKAKRLFLLNWLKGINMGLMNKMNGGCFVLKLKLKKVSGWWTFPKMGAKKGFNNRGNCGVLIRRLWQTEGITKDESSNARVINNEPELLNTGNRSNN